MNQHGSTWALILAAGEGTRLRTLTTTHSGTSVPKQFCSLRGGASLFQEALMRGSRICSPEHLCTVVAAQHQHWWQPATTRLCSDNVIVQPQNLGTAIGILLPLLQIVQRDANARVVLLPADHHIDDEAVLTESIRKALASLTLHRDQVFLLGIEPDEPDTELGYIIPSRGDSSCGLKIEKFVEKPDRQTVLKLLDVGALWNSFIMVARAQAILDLYTRHYEELLMEMRAVVTSQWSPQSAVSVVDLYARLPTLDFSKNILEHQEPRLRVMPVAHCGWTDLGTPKRVGEVLRKNIRASSTDTMTAHLNLSIQHARLKTMERHT